MKTGSRGHNRHAAAVLAALMVAQTAACLDDIDFDAIAPRCELPRFDRPNRDTWCSGRVEALGPVSAEVEGEAMVLGQDASGVLVVGGTTLGQEGLRDWFVGFDVAWVPAADIGTDGELGSVNALRRHIDLAAFGEGASAVPPPTQVLSLVGGEPVVLMNVTSGIVFMDLTATGTEGLASLNSPDRLPITAEDSFQLYRHAIVSASPLNPTRRRILTVATVSGLKAFYYEQDASQRWTEIRPGIPATLRRGLSHGRCDLECAEPSALACASCASATWRLFLAGDSVEALTWTVAVDDPNAPTTAYAGGVGGITAFDATLLDPFGGRTPLATDNSGYERLARDKTDRWQAPVTGDDGVNLIHTFNALSVHDGVLWATAFAQPADDGANGDQFLFAPSRVVLFGLELAEDGAIARMLSRTELPHETRLQWVADLTFAGRDLLVVQAAETVLTEETLPAYGSSDVITLDISDPTAPVVVAQRLVESTSTHALGMAVAAGTDHGGTLLLPTADVKIQPVQLELNGGLLAP